MINMSIKFFKREFQLYFHFDSSLVWHLILIEDIQNHQGNTFLGVFVTVFPEKFNWGGETHAICGQHHSMGWRTQTEAEKQHPLLSASWLQMQCDWLLKPQTPCPPRHDGLNPQTVNQNKLFRYFAIAIIKRLVVNITVLIRYSFFLILRILVQLDMVAHDYNPSTGEAEAVCWRLFWSK